MVDKYFSFHFLLSETFISIFIHFSFLENIFISTKWVYITDKVSIKYNLLIVVMGMNFRIKEIWTHLFIWKAISELILSQKYLWMPNLKSWTNIFYNFYQLIWDCSHGTCFCQLWEWEKAKNRCVRPEK